MTMKKELNRNDNSLTRIYVERRIDTLHYSHNDRESWNSLKNTAAFIARCEKKSKGFVNIRVEPTSDDSDPNNLESHAIEVIGFRLETNKEFKRRLETILFEKERKQASSKQSAVYYTSKEFAKELEIVKKAIKKIK